MGLGRVLRKRTRCRIDAEIVIRLYHIRRPRPSSPTFHTNIHGPRCMPIPLGANVSVAGFPGQLSLCVCPIRRSHLFVHSSCAPELFKLASQVQFTASDSSLIGTSNG